MATQLELETGKVNFVVYRPDYLQKSLIQPQAYNEALYWASSHGITAKELNNAILHTGTLDIEVLKNYLKDTGVLVPLTHRVAAYVKGGFYNLYRNAHLMWTVAKKKKALLPRVDLKMLLHR